MAHRSSVPLAITLGSILILFAGFIAIMWWLGFFDFTGTDPSSKVVAAALALVGTFVGTIVSIVGIILKHSIDQQTESRQESESRRTAALQWEAEQRLKLEAAIRALQLFSTNSGSPTPAVQRDGALFTLSNLGQHELTLQLADDLLAKGELSAGVASSLIDQAILRGNEDEKEQAITVFGNNAARMATSSGAAIPNCLADWAPGLPNYVREWAPIAIADVMLARPASEWSATFRYQAYGVIAALGIAWSQETVPRLKTNIGAILNHLLTAFPHTGTLWHPRMEVDTVRIREDVANLAADDSHVAEVVQRLAQWASPDDTAKVKTDTV